MRTYVRPGVEHTIPASPRAKRLPQGSAVPVPVRQVRAELNISRSEVARTAALGDEVVQRLEDQPLAELQALDAYARALGGTLELAIAFGPKRYPIDFSPGALDAAKRNEVEELDDPFPPGQSLFHLESDPDKS